MGEESLNDVNVLLSKVEEFEQTISNLNDNVKKFKERLLEKKKKFGPDMSKWPEEKK